MSLWATKRKIMYGGSVVFVILAVVVFIGFEFIYKAPSCNDGLQNGDEKGVDCGGSCPTLCTSDALTPVVLWSKVFNISGDVYTAAALVQNPNINSENNSATYKFRIYDVNNRLIATKEGSVFIPKNKNFLALEPGIVLKNSIPKSADFQFQTFSPWQRNNSQDPDISVDYGTIESTSTAPILRGTITNNSLQNIPEIELDVVVLDANENAIGASRTFVDHLNKGTSQDFVFTWQNPFSANINVVNVMYHIVNQTN